ncbi:3710_t:CDS:2, partial [Racocetra persica]
MDNDPKEPAQDIDQQIKKHIDSAYQQIQTTINERLNKLKQARLMDGEPNLNNNQPTEEEQSNLTTPITICSSARTKDDIIPGNYPPTPTFNRRIVNLMTQDTASSADNSVNEILSSIPPQEIPMTPEEMQTLLQIDLDKFN